MPAVLVTGANGFIGRNLCAHLRERADLALLTVGRDTPDSVLEEAIAAADVIVHLAGVNRPPDPSEFDRGNIGYTETLARMVTKSPRQRRIIFVSSIQADNDTPYGQSKRTAEECLQNLAQDQPLAVSVLRLRNVFGKWCRPNYNSVVATFCHNIANDLPIDIHDPDRPLDLVFIDDVVEAIEREIESPIVPHEFRYCGAEIPISKVSLGDLANHLRTFREIRTSLLIPDLSTRVLQQLYATYLSYVEPKEAAYSLQARHDARGSLAEFIKSEAAGQIFVSRTRPGIMRGNHYHHTKTEKFLVLEGEGLIQLRQIDNDARVEFRVSGTDYRVVDIPPGYTHSITNTGDGELITLFWVSEIFDPNRADTFPLPVVPNIAAPGIRQEQAA
jgi:UDP-2-acetamido-2,6-beta-L-arabino-hexul-4-ose reductase